MDWRRFIVRSRFVSRHQLAKCVIITLWQTVFPETHWYYSIRNDAAIIVNFSVIFNFFIVLRLHHCIVVEGMLWSWEQEWTKNTKLTVTTGFSLLISGHMANHHSANEHLWTWTTQDNGVLRVPFGCPDDVSKSKHQRVSTFLISYGRHSWFYDHTSHCLKFAIHLYTSILISLVYHSARVNGIVSKQS